ncbi:MAG: adenylyltransferase/cytidyltransferase family protein [Clostridia bacterium]|nr:adenylyltransferase/cytidyltransferase family protein [Clostridia bacterium]
MKQYDTGLIIGRFQHFHLGHQALVGRALQLCDKVLILVGPSEEHGTYRDPYLVSTRIEVITTVYNDKSDAIIVKEIPNLMRKEDIMNQWGNYVLGKANSYLHQMPSLIVYGDDEYRSKWFQEEDLKGIAQLVIPRSKIPISATLLREALVRDDFGYWSKFVDKKIYGMYHRLREELLTTESYQEMYQNILNGNL